MRAAHYRLGEEGEAAAKRYLAGCGYRIVQANYRYQKAEVDLIALQGETVVFIEVKTRSSGYFGAPQDFVTRKKKRLLIQAADAFMESKNWDREVRFDVVAILKNQGSYQIKHIEGAFETFET